MGIERIISNMNHKHEIRGEKTYPEVEKALRGLYENEDYRNEMLDKYRGKILNKEDYKELSTPTFLDLILDKIPNLNNRVLRSYIKSLLADETFISLLFSSIFASPSK